MGERVDLGTVGEGNGTLTRRVKGGKEEDEQAHKASANVAQIGVQERAQTGSEKGPEHLREGEEQQASSTKGVNGVEGREGKQPVHQTKTKGSNGGLELGEARLHEDGGGIECDNVDSAHLLRNHDRKGSQVGAAHAGNGEELAEAGGVVGLADDLFLNLELGADVEDVASNLDVVEAEHGHGLPCVGVALLLHVPTRGFGAEVDTEEERDGGDEGGTKHESPVDIRYTEDGKVESSSQHDAESGPHFCAIVSIELIAG